MGARRGELGRLSGSGRGNSSWTNTSRFGGTRGRSNFGGSRFAGTGRFENASFSHSRFGNRGFGGARGYRDGGWGYGGFHHYGYGFGGWGGDPWFSDLWFLGDLFGLALDFGRFAITPAWGFLAPSLLDASLQAFNSVDSNDDSYDNSNIHSYDNSYGGEYGNSYGDYDSGQYYATSLQYPALCGRYYSDENPGCRQQY